MKKFRNIHPINCQLLNEQGENALYWGATEGQELTLQVENVSGKAMEFSYPLAQVSDRNYHFSLQFRSKILKSGLHLKEESAKDWEVAGPFRDDQGSVWVYLQYVGEVLTLAASQQLQVHFENVKVMGEAPHETRVQFRIRGLTYMHSPGIDIAGSRMMSLQIDDKIPFRPPNYTHFQQEDNPTEEKVPASPEEEPKVNRWEGAIDINISVQAKFEKHITLTHRKSAPSGFKIKTEGEWAIIVPSEGAKAKLQVYKQEGRQWIRHQEIEVPEGTWGGGASLSKDWLAITAHDKRGIGKVVFYQLENNQWTEQQTIHATTHNNWFGEDLVMHEDKAILGAQMGGNIHAATGQATAYEFDGSQWVESELRSATGGKDFGRSLAMKDDWAVIGPESVHSFQHENGKWQEQQTLEPTAGTRIRDTMDMTQNQIMAGATTNQGQNKQAIIFDQVNSQLSQSQVLNLPNDLDRPNLPGININQDGE